jgi:CHAT domain-containing protein
MAAFGRSLCLILTLWMAGSRSPTVIPPRSPDSSPWWDQASLKIQQNALRLRKAGDFRAADALYLEGYREGVRRGDRLASVRYLMSAGGCELLALEYRAALASFLRARELATAVDDHADLGAIAVNLSSLYLEMWDLPSANRAADEGLRQTALLVGDVTRGAYFKPHLLVQLGRIHSALGDGQADGYFAVGIEAARVSGDFALEAMAWDQQGAEHLAAGRLREAENKFLEAFRLRRFFRPGDLGWSYGHLGALAFARHDFGTAERFTQLALGHARRGEPAWPEYLLLQQQGRIRLARREIGAALSDFSLALEATAEWRLQILPARSSLISANVALEHQIFDSFIQLAAQHALQTGNPDWTARAFQAVEINRAASLRESLALADVWRERLAPEYWETLAQLGAEEARGRGAGTFSSETGGDRTELANANRLRLKLTEMEAEAGIGLQVKKVENFRSRISLIHFQEGLRGSELFLSFELGEKESYLWAVSRNSLRLYRLAAERDIAKSVQTFREAIPAGGAEAVRQGRQLYQQLFGQLKPQEIQKPAWLLSLDGALFNVPFAALVAGQGANPVYLVDTHTLQTVSGALLLNAASDSASSGRRRGGEFLGVGDPIYNQVDPRWRGPVSDRSPTGQLQRLVGSRIEVESSANAWQAGGGAAVVLQGPEAKREAFLRRLERQPAVIHLATHVLFPTANREQGLIAFSLGDPRAGDSRNAGSTNVGSPAIAAEPEFLTTSEIAGLRVPGALVVMTGCATGSGEAQAGAGLLGLTRAWLMAGASTVISTTWPVEDNSGGIFARFYFYLRDHSAAEALQLSQREAAHSRTGRQGPESWASYQVTGGIH